MIVALVIVSIIAVFFTVFFFKAVNEFEKAREKCKGLTDNLFKLNERHKVTVNLYMQEMAEHKKAIKIIDAYRKKDKIKVVSINDKETVEACLNAGYEVNICGIPKEAGLITFISRGEKMKIPMNEAMAEVRDLLFEYVDCGERFEKVEKDFRDLLIKIAENGIVQEEECIN